MKENYGKLPFPKMSPDLLSFVKTGDVYDLGVVRSHDMPLWYGHPPFRVLPYKYHGETNDSYPGTTLYNEMVVTCMHAGTHVDCLNHMGYKEDGKNLLYKEVDPATVRQWWGCDWMDGSKYHPIILRAVILDMLAFKGGEDTGGEITLPRRYEITAEDFKNCMEANHIEVRPDLPTAFLFRTGYIKFFHNIPKKYEGSAPGPNREAVEYLASIGGVLMGSDTSTFEHVAPNAKGDVHAWMMKNGYIINEVLDLEEICAAGVTEGVYIALPTKIKGTSAALVDPIIIA